MLFSCHSPKRVFFNELAELQSTVKTESRQITTENIAHLPEPVRRYLHHCGFVDRPMANNAEVIWADSRIKMKPGQRWMRLKTLQHNFVEDPCRIAYMRANMLGLIPFEGRDRYLNGGGHMFGTLGRMIKVFDARDRETFLGAAVVVLAEVLLIPLYSIQPYIHWEAVDDLTAKARFIHNGIDWRNHLPSISSISAKNNINLLTMSFRPSFPCLNTFTANTRYRGRFMISGHESVGTISGEYHIQSDHESVTIRVVPSKGWKPKATKFSTRFLFTVARVFKKWPTTYQWDADLQKDSEGVWYMQSKWIRTGRILKD